MIRTLVFLVFLLVPIVTESRTPPNHPVQAYWNYPQTGYYVLKNHDMYYAYNCWVRFPDGYTIQFPLYPLVVSNPFPMNTDFGCY